MSFCTAAEKLKDDLIRYLSDQGFGVYDFSYVSEFGTTVYCPQIGKKQDKIDFLKWIYDDCTIYLDRKYEKYQEVIDPLNQKWLSNKARKKSGTLRWESEWKAVFKSAVTCRA